MAIEPSVAYSGQTAVDGAYPYGKAQNVTAPGTGDGTPLEEQWLNDLWGFLQALLVEAAITPSGSPDEVGASDYLNAIRFMALGAAISPTAIASNQSDYSPTDWSRCGVARLTSDANRTILGFSSNAVVGRKLIVNANSTAARSITLKHDDGTQGLGNKLISPTGRDYVLMPGSSCLLYLDGDSDCWRIATDRNAATDLAQDSTATIGFLRQAFAWLGTHSFAPATTDTNGITSTGNGTGAGAYCTGGPTGHGCVGIAGGNLLDGVVGLGNGAAPFSGSGVGVTGKGQASRAGGFFYGPGSGSPEAGCVGVGDSGNNPGVRGAGNGSGPGGTFTGGATGEGGEFTGGATGNSIRAKTGGLYGVWIETPTNRAHMHMEGIAGDPPGVTDGDIWYNSSTGKFRCREGGATKDMI